MLHTRIGVKSERLAQFRVYCTDGTIRRHLGYRERKLRRPFISLLLGNGFWSGIPILSEAVGSYTFEDLRKEVGQRLVRAYQTTEARSGIKERIRAATTFDELLDIVLDPTALG